MSNKPMQTVKLLDDQCIKRAFKEHADIDLSDELYQKLSVDPNFIPEALNAAKTDFDAEDNVRGDETRAVVEKYKAFCNGSASLSW